MQSPTAYILQSDGNWHKVGANEEAYVPPFRGYFQANTAKTANQLVTMLNAIELSDVADIRTLSDASFDNGVLMLNFTPAAGDDPVNPVEGAVTSITAGTPYIIKWANAEENIVSPVFSGVTISSVMNDKTCDLGNGKSITFTGTFAGHTFTTEDKSVLFLGDSNTLYYPQAGASIGAQRAYFQLVGLTAGEVATARLFFSDESTDIVSISKEFGWEGAASGLFTLDGRKVASVGADSVPARLPKGICINNGKKVVIKQ